MASEECPDSEDPLPAGIDFVVEDADAGDGFQPTADGVLSPPVGFPINQPPTPPTTTAGRSRYSGVCECPIIPRGLKTRRRSPTPREKATSARPSSFPGFSSASSVSGVDGSFGCRRSTRLRVQRLRS